jgi:hypothetical protein
MPRMISNENITMAIVGLSMDIRVMFIDLYSTIFTFDPSDRRFNPEVII